MRVVNEQWRDSLASDRYPFTGTGSISTDDGLVMSADCFLDLNLFVAQAVTTVLLSQVVVELNVPAVVTFTLADGTIVGTLDFDDLQGNQQAPIRMGTAVVGVAVMDPTAVQIVNGWPIGTHTFTGLQVIPHLLVALDKAWRRGVELPDGTILEGTCYLVAGQGLWLSRSGTGFSLSVTGDPYNGRTVAQRGLTSINGVLPGPDGNINLIGLSADWADGGLFRITLKPSSQSLIIELVTG